MPFQTPRPRLCAWAGRVSTRSRRTARTADGAIIHRGENMNYAANGEGLSRSAPIRTTIIRYLRERGKKA